jgi:hypothetical protein
LPSPKLGQLSFARVGSIKDGDEVIGNTTRVKIVENNMAQKIEDAIRRNAGLIAEPIPKDASLDEEDAEE